MYKIYKIIWKGESDMATWKEVRENLSLTPADECIIAIEKQLIRNMIKIREEKGWTQSELAEYCNVKQPTIARMESNVHSPQLDSLLRVLTSLGYTLQIVPMSQANPK